MGDVETETGIVSQCRFCEKESEFTLHDAEGLAMALASEPLLLWVFLSTVADCDRQSRGAVALSLLEFSGRGHEAAETFLSFCIKCVVTSRSEVE